MASVWAIRAGKGRTARKHCRFALCGGLRVNDAHPNQVRISNPYLLITANGRAARAIERSDRLKITYIAHDGAEYVVDAVLGQSVMEAAVKNAVPGIDADCGGACACATCHVYIDPAWRSVTGGPSAMESSMLDCIENLEAGSRLACQIRLKDGLDGLVVRLPASQFLV